MATTRYHTLIAGPARKNDPQVVEGLTTIAIIPGSLVKYDGINITYHATPGGEAVQMIAMPNVIGGGDIRDAIPAGDTCAAVLCEDNVDYHVRVKAGEVLKTGDGLVSAGDGTLQKSTAPAANQVLFFARETYTVASDGAELVKVRKSGTAAL